MSVSYQLRPQYVGSFSGGVINVGGAGYEFNIGTALAAGGGVIVAADADLINALDRYPPLYRIAETSDPQVPALQERLRSVSVGNQLGVSEVALEVRRNNEPYARWQVEADGTVSAGDGSAPPSVLSTAPTADRTALELIADYLRTPTRDDLGRVWENGVRRSVLVKKPTGAARLTGHVEFFDGMREAAEDPSTSPDPEGLLEASASKRPNTTALGLTVQFFARYALLASDPAQRRDLTRWADLFAQELLTYQHAEHTNDPALRRGGFKLAPTDSHATSFGTGICGMAMLLAFKATNNSAYYVSARSAADFLLRMADPNTYWGAAAPDGYGVSPINRTVGGVTWRGFMDRVDDNDKLNTTSTTWNLTAAAFLRALADYSGPTLGAAYGTVADQVRDFAAQAVIDGYDLFAVQSNVFTAKLTTGIATTETTLAWQQTGPTNPPGSYPFDLTFSGEQMTVTAGSGGGSIGATGSFTVTRSSAPTSHALDARFQRIDALISAQWNLSSGHIYNDHTLRRLGSVSNTGTIGTDQIEYGLQALYRLGYDIGAILDAFGYWRNLPHSGALHIASENGGGTPDYSFGEAYNGGYTLPGYMRAGGTIADGSFPDGFRPARGYGRYYDAQGADTLYGLKAKHFPADATLAAQIVRNTTYRASLLDKDLNSIFTSSGGTDTATKGMIVISSAGLGILDALEGVV